MEMWGGYTNVIGDSRWILKREKKYFTVFGLVETVLASIFRGSSVHAAFMVENLGFLLLTRVASRFFIIIVEHWIYSTQLLWKDGRAYGSHARASCRSSFTRGCISP